MAKKQEKEAKLSLPDKTIHIVVLDKARATLIKDDVKTGSESVFPTTTKRSYALPPKISGGLVNPFLIYTNGDVEKAEEIQELLEEKLSLEYGELSTNFITAHQMNESLWTTNEFRLTFEKTNLNLGSATIILDLKNPNHFVQYLIALGLTYEDSRLKPIVAPSWEARNDKASYIYAIKDLALAQDEVVKTATQRAALAGRLAEVYNSGDIEMLRLYYELYAIKDSNRAKSRKLVDTADISVLYTELDAMTNDKGRAKILSEVVNMPVTTLSDWKIYFKGRKRGLIRAQHANSLHTFNGTSMGNSASEAMMWLNRDENSKWRLLIDSE